MKLAWIVIRDEGDTPEIHYARPPSGWYHRVTMIVYAEVDSL